MINLRPEAFSLFEGSSVHTKSNEDLRGPKCSNYYQHSEHCVSARSTECLYIELCLYNRMLVYKALYGSSLEYSSGIAIYK